ncbi:TetR/AcrR family transcriptional regulator [Brachybacterium sp.]|uniref:TetR/AcrR family transcriptional regulator n=1 Tax=Brachybacterium sp. TaxID=1891286 RepID=UPI002ED57E5B
MPSTARSTPEHVQRTALALFAASGYDQVTVAAIARAAGVSHMTFFRHFPTKESVVVGDVFDPLIALAVAQQPEQHPPLRRAVDGLLGAMADPAAREHLGSEEFRLRIRLAASTPSLRAAVRAATQVTEDEIARALGAGGTAPRTARAAAGALMGAASAVLLDWAGGDDGTEAASALTRALQDLLRGAP